MREAGPVATLDATTFTPSSSRKKTNQPTPGRNRGRAGAVAAGLPLLRSDGLIGLPFVPSEREHVGVAAGRDEDDFECGLADRRAPGAGPARNRAARTCRLPPRVCSSRHLFRVDGSASLV